MHEAMSNDDARWVRITGGAVVLPALNRGGSVGKIRLSPETVLGVDRTRRLDPLSQLALVAVELARADAGLKPWDHQDKVIDDGIAVGSALGAVTTTVRYAGRLIAAGPSATNPIDFPDSVDGAAAGHVAMDLGLGGPSITFTDGTTSAVAALVYAARQIAWGRAARMHVVVGDRFDAFFEQALANDPTLQHVYPCECLMALVLEGCHSLQIAGDSILLSGFLAGSSQTLRQNGEVSADRSEVSADRSADCWQFADDGTAQYGSKDQVSQKVLMNPSGALELASAWVAVRGAKASLIGATPIDTQPKPVVHVGGQSYPNLAFVNAQQSLAAGVSACDAEMPPKSQS